MLPYFRHHRLWLVFTLVIAIVLSVGGASVAAAVCDGAVSAPSSVSDGRLGQELSTPPACAMAEMAATCCCRSKATVATEPNHAAVHSVSGAGCGCSIEAPTIPPAADLNQAALTKTPTGILLAPAPVLVTWPVASPWIFAAPTTGPPRQGAPASTPSRAPPAC